MSDDQIKPDFTLKPPTEQELPQGAQAFIQALESAYNAVGELYAPYVERMPAVGRNFEQTMTKLREAGMWTNDALTMIMNPQMFQVAKPEQPESEDAPPQEDQ